MPDSNRRILGFGLDAQHAARYPGGMAGLCDRFRSRLTHISVVSLWNADDALEFTSSCSKGLPVVQHLPGIAPADVGGPHMDRIPAINSVAVALKARWNTEDIGIWSVGPYALPHFAPPIFEHDVVRSVADGVRRILQSTSIPFLAETPICGFTLGRMNYGDFFHALVDKSGCEIALDTPHVYSYALTTGQDPSRVLRSLPLDAVTEFHVAGGRLSDVSRRYYVDSHSDPITDAVLDLTVEALSLCSHARCVTYEIGVGLSDSLIAEQFELLETTLSTTGWQPTL